MIPLPHEIAVLELKMGAWGRLGSLWVSSWEPFGGSWRPLGRSWGPLGDSWGPLRALLGAPGAPGGRKPDFLNFFSTAWASLGALLGRFGRLLGRLGALLGRLGALLGASWAVLGPFWRLLGPS